MATIMESGTRRILENEDCETGRLFMNAVGPLFGKERQNRAICVYGYIRAIEDEVDDGHNPKKGEALLHDEITYIKARLKGERIESKEGNEPFIWRELLDESLNGLTKEQEISVLRTTLRVVGGINLDNKSIQRGRPWSEEVLKRRHVYESMTGFEIMSVLLFDRDLLGKNDKDGEKKKDHLQRLCCDWIEYDALIDLQDDLQAGLILFSNKILDKYRVVLNRGEVIPDTVRNLFEQEKERVMKSLGSNARYILESSLPKLYTIPLWFYFVSRVLKLNNCEYPIEKGTVFGQNLNPSEV